MVYYQKLKMCIRDRLYDTLTGIQMGTIEAPEGWIRKIV